MLSESTAHLVEHTAVLADTELGSIKGKDDPVSARRLLAIEPRHARPVARNRTWSVGVGRWPLLRPWWTARSGAAVAW